MKKMFCPKYCSFLSARREETNDCLNKIRYLAHFSKEEQRTDQIGSVNYILFKGPGFSCDSGLEDCPYKSKLVPSSGDNRYTLY